jgi:hypothetical protein
VNFLPWLEYNIHFCSQPNYADLMEVISDLLKPFVDSHREFFNHWHYLLEPDVCRPNSSEIRLRFEGSPENLEQIKCELVREVGNFGHRTNLVMSDEDPVGSHEGRHGDRNRHYEGVDSEDWTVEGDWEKIVKILQIGSDSALQILKLARELVENNSLQRYRRTVDHPYFIHLPANQLIFEP